MMGMRMLIRYPELPHAFLAQGVDDDGHADIGVEPVAALGKGAGLKGRDPPADIGQ